MGGFKNIGPSDYLKRYGIKYAIKRGIFLANPLHIVSDYENRKLLYYIRTMKYLRKKYLIFCDDNTEKISFPNIEVEKNRAIWVYWKQGIENSPEIIQVCIRSIMRYCGERVILLDDKNLEKYIVFDNSYKEHMIKKCISDAALSDLIRFALLEHYGGTWIDSTILLTDKLPEYIENQVFFTYRDLPYTLSNPASRTTWLIHSKANSQIMRWARNMAFAYWELENHVVEYVLPYFFLELAIEKDRTFLKTEVPVSSNPCYYLLQRIGDEYDEGQFETIKKITSVHKLSYKLYEEVMTNENSYYSTIVRKGN